MSVAALAVALQTVLATDAAASCGDWLAGRAHEKAAVTGLPAEATSSSGGPNGQDIASHTPAAPLDAPTPCQGPGCRRAPEVPPPPAPQRTLTDSRDRWLTLAGQPLVEMACARRLVLEETLNLPAGLRPRVDRPPRV